MSSDPRNPDHVFLGTSTGTIFQSKDGGHSWSRFAHLGQGDNYVVDHIVFDPQNPNTMFVAVWSVENQKAGEIYRSHDGGKTWEALPRMHGESVRALAISASNPNVLAAGALDGVFRTSDGGETWDRISPASQEVKNVESIAIDPKDPKVIYAGTWHLAWKTPDAGANWEHINKGMIDDSDVFSIIVDSANPSVVFASACSGIYKSETAGELFKKIQGIPFTARRTRVLKQDPSNPDTVYAGTTEGLWKTTDLGKSWKLMSSPEVVVNDVSIDPRNSARVLLATDRGGVLASDDGTQTLASSNHGYTHRYVTSIVADKNDPNNIFVGTVNDQEFGGVYASHDGGQHWMQKSAGLKGQDVFTLKQTANGELVAGTNRGIFVLAHNANEWQPANTVINEKVSMHRVKGSKKAVSTKTVTRSVIEGRVNDLQVASNRWWAATSAGLFSSSNHGKSWSGGPVLGNTEFSSVQSNDSIIAAATHTTVLVSKDAGTTWQQSSLASSYVTSIRGVTITPDSQIIIASREGAFESADNGATWHHLLNGIPDKNISSVSYDEQGRRLLATSTETGVVFQSSDSGRTWHRGPDSGYPMRRISVVHGRYMAATPFDGVIVQPENESENANASIGSN
ncbi:MAG TPA: transcriptional regulator [Terriglobales bacterium]|nr:transcriptional regulator [Terriglobales bacterium]